MNKLAARRYYDKLFDKDSLAVREYVKKRALEKGAIIRFGLGYAKDSWDDILNYLKSCGYSQDEIVLAGLAAKNEKGRVYDKFRNRLMFPIIDVRGNNGGYLSDVTTIMNELLPKGSVIYQIEKNGVKEKTFDKTDGSKDYPIVVLTNGTSASASEILAAAIKESYGGYVVGTTTYGKGTVQQTKVLSDGTMLKFTVENWLTPEGNWINDVGIKPTHEVKMDESYYDNPVDENDTQLQKALELVSE